MWLSNNNVIAVLFLAASYTCGIQNDEIHGLFLGEDFSPVSPLLQSPIIKN